MNDRTVWLTWVIFVVTYAGLALGKVPGLRMNRAGIAYFRFAARLLPVALLGLVLTYLVVLRVYRS